MPALLPSNNTHRSSGPSSHPTRCTASACWLLLLSGLRAPLSSWRPAWRRWRRWCGSRRRQTGGGRGGLGRQPAGQQQQAPSARWPCRARAPTSSRGACIPPAPFRIPYPLYAHPLPPGPASAVATVLSLEEHCQRLFLLVLAADPPPGLTEADLIHGLALLATLFNAAYGMVWRGASCVGAGRDNSWSWEVLAWCRSNSEHAFSRARAVLRLNSSTQLPPPPSVAPPGARAHSLLCSSAPGRCAASRRGSAAARSDAVGRRRRPRAADADGHSGHCPGSWSLLRSQQRRWCRHATTAQQPWLREAGQSTAPRQGAAGREGGGGARWKGLALPALDIDVPVRP